jgi:hypothetical protein
MHYQEMGAAVVVIGHHTSKSVKCPVYLINAPWATVVMRDNFHNWNVSVKSKVGKIEIEAPELITEHNANYLFFEGMDKDWQFKPYAEDKSKFSLTAWDDYKLYTIMYLMKREGIKRLEYWRHR